MENGYELPFYDLIDATKSGDKSRVDWKPDSSDPQSFNGLWQGSDCCISQIKINNKTYIITLKICCFGNCEYYYYSSDSNDNIWLDELYNNIKMLSSCSN